MSTVQESITRLFDDAISEFEQDSVEVALTEARKRMELADKNFEYARSDQHEASTRSLLLATAMLHEQRAANLLALVKLSVEAPRLA